MDLIEYSGTTYSEIKLSIIADEKFFAADIASIKDTFKDGGACVLNAYLVGRKTEAVCVEGFVICVEPPNQLGVIKHVWNKLNGNHYDVTKEYIWTVSSATRHHYFPISEHNYLDYNTEQQDGVDICFLSNAGEISKGVQEQLFEILKTKK